MAGVSSLRVRALQTQRRRGGFVFTREAVDLHREDLPTDDLLGLRAFLGIVADPLLDAAVTDDGRTFYLTAEHIAKLRAQVEALEAAAQATPANPGVAALAKQLLADETELQPASGAVGQAGGEASPPVNSTASSGASHDDGASANSPGDATSSAEGAGQSREAANALASDQKAGSDEGNQPGETPQSPVAESTQAPIAAPAAGKPAGRAKRQDTTKG